MLLSGLTDKQLEASPYLSDISRDLRGENSFSELLSKVPSAGAADLLTLKAKFSYKLATSPYSSFDEIGAIWSSFADATLDRALALAWREAATRHKLNLPDGEIPGLFVLGLGKLGGYDLNFSSDVDLIAFYDADILPVPEHMGQAFIASDICKRMTQILQPRNSPNFVWRVDWRLRPESSGTGLAISTAKAETFYFFRSLPWHRLALMKARPIAGDKDAGSDFLARLEPFIWRRNLDYTTLDDLAALKSRINNEHPGLEFERSSPEPITEQASGFNLKLGRGGIREIEFIANAQQLIHGGKRPTLRVTHTRTALSQLAATELLKAADVKELREDYSFFRQIENAVQMFANEQTHIVPTGETRSSLLTLLGNPKDLDHIVFERRTRVHKKFAALFADKPIDEATLDTSALEGKNIEIASSWRNGFRDHGLSTTQQRKYQDLGQRLTARVLSQPREDQAFERVDKFLKQIGRSEPYFALLNRHPSLLDKLISPLLHSPHMSEILRQSPHIIDIFIASNSESLSEQSQFVLTSSDYEHRLEALRRFVNEQLFLSYSRFMDGQSTTKETQSELTALAEQSLTLALKIVQDDLGLTELPMTVLGLGKMGTQAMAPQSDLDLIFIFTDEMETELASKIVQRLKTTLTVKLREGIAYELDMRLRPSGRSGPPAVKLSSFREHHMKRAHNWEHIALAPARIVAGNPLLGEQVIKIKNEILSRPRDLQAFKQDAWAMFSRLSAERLQSTPTNMWRTKLRRGGLMTADYLHSCQVVTGETPLATFEEARSTWSTLQFWERLLGLKGLEFDETPDRYKEKLKLKSFSKTQEALESQITQAVSVFFDELSDTDLPDPRPVVWKN